ncbi:hypothetical protein GWI33_016737 [Rhynchophorus ferrugineus]|uniref:Uncharacterized protein n=1 Tax=Rhynchophorus ferrugineus TaxID=354439 RepID=A0A834M6U8_RHYFE|nr:hypothetical protein GWI33_016737 [Rhynchophorus ferrugineus]
MLIHFDSVCYRPTSVHSDHNYARPRLIAQGQLNTRIADPIRQRHFKTRTTFTSQEQMRSQECDHPRAPAINRPNSQVVAPELDSNVAAHMRTTYANNKSPLHLHRLPEDPLPFKIVKSRYQPNPYAIAQKRPCLNFRSILKKLPPPDSSENRPNPLKSHHNPLLKIADKENAIDLTVEKISSVEPHTAANIPPEVISLD